MAKKKLLTPREQHFAKLIAENEMGSIEAHRVAFGSRCEPDSKESQAARDLARSRRVREEIERIKSQRVKTEQAKQAMMLEIGNINLGNLRDRAFKILENMRDTSGKAQSRLNAVRILKKLHDPGKDINLIWKWIDIAWRYQTAHCPSCHKDFHLAKAKNDRLDAWRERSGADEAYEFADKFSRRLELIRRADKRRVPHKSQVEALTATERHIVGLGAARAGKSYLLALFAAMGVCLPGVEIWILGETFDRTAKEVEYLQRFLEALFYPYYNKLVRVSHDKKTGEMIMNTKWGSQVRVKSSKAKGSITGHALEFALCAEPGWLPADIYEELRARMSERLGRIIALGTPKGLGGFVGRLVNMTGRDPSTGKVIRLKPHERLLKNGAPWGISMLVMNLDPVDNPEYVKSELSSARMELSDAEYAQEFEGIGTASEGSKFGRVRPAHLLKVDKDFFERASFVLGIDQGPVNFGTVLTAYDGEKVVPCWEFFNSDDKVSMKRNLVRLRANVPKWIRALGGDPDNWKLTITDHDPVLTGVFSEMEQEGQPWPTETTTRHVNKRQFADNWRRETQEYVNNLARRDELLFHLVDDIYMAHDDDESPGTYVLHDQVMTCMDVPEDRERESRPGVHKGWQTSDPFRGDHVLDAWYFTMWAIYSDQLRVPKSLASKESTDPWADQKAAFEYALERDEARELSGYRSGNPHTEQGQRAMWEKYFGYNQPASMFRPKSVYGEES